MTQNYLVLDPNFNSTNLILSPDGLTVNINEYSSNFNAEINTQVIGQNPLSTGLYYFEVRIEANNSQNGYGIGIIDGLFEANLINNNNNLLLTPIPYIYTSQHSAFITERSNIYINGTEVATSIGNAGGGSYTVCVAVSFTSSLIWFKIGQIAGQSITYWNGSPSANPATGVGGLDISGLTGPFTPVISMPAGQFGAFTANFGNTVSWNQYNGINVLYDSAFIFPTRQSFIHNYDSNHAQIYSPCGIQTTPTYFELQCVDGTLTGTGNDAAAGITVSDPYTVFRENLTTPNGAFVCENGSIYINGVLNAASLGSLVTGDILRVYLDGAGNIAFAINGGDWNGSYSDSQIAAGTGLFALGFAGPWYPMVSITSAAGLEAWTLNATSTTCTYPLISGASYLSPYGYVPPSGFSSWPAATGVGMRVSQIGMDAMNDNPDTNVRVSYDSLETLNSLTTANARISHVDLETLLLLNSTNARASQVVMQVMTPVFVSTVNSSIMII